MAEAFDYGVYDTLMAQGLSQRQAFEKMGVKRSTGQDALKRRESGAVALAPVAVLPPPPPGRETPTGEVLMPLEGEMEAMKADLWEVVQWWRSRKLRQAQPRQTRDMARWTIHVDPHWKERVMELSDAQRTSITDVVDEVFRAYFEHPR
jgi:hypothetical protein